MKLAFVSLLLLFFCGCNGQPLKKVVKTYFPDGRLRSTTETVNDKKNGVETLYHKNGGVFMIQHFKDDLPVDSVIVYDTNSTTVIQKGICRINSRMYLYDTANSIIAETDFIEGAIADGLVKFYFSNGHVAVLAEERHGKKNGIRVMYYYPGDKVRSIEHFKNDSLVYPIIKFDSAGNAKSIYK